MTFDPPPTPLCMSVLPFIRPYNPQKKFSFGVNASIRIGQELRCLPYAEFFFTFFFFTNKSIGQKKWNFFQCHKMYFFYHIMFLSTFLLVKTIFFLQFLLRQFVSKIFSCHNKWIESNVQQKKKTFFKFRFLTFLINFTKYVC